MSKPNPAFVRTMLDRQRAAVDPAMNKGKPVRNVEAAFELFRLCRAGGVSPPDWVLDAVEAAIVALYEADDPRTLFGWRQKFLNRKWKLDRRVAGGEAADSPAIAKAYQRLGLTKRRK